jgi:hypothetical protein
MVSPALLQVPSEMPAPQQSMSVSQSPFVPEQLHTFVPAKLPH